MEWEEQLRSFAVLFGWGILLGIALDGYRAFCRIGHLRDAMILVTDCLAWSIGAITIFAVSFSQNGGDIRFYFLLAIAIGYGIYRHICAERVVGIWMILARWVRRLGVAMQSLVKAVLRPVRFLLRLCVVVKRYIFR